ncbi:MAG: cytochrome c biogenesis protein CcdA [Planctomycetota bacterium]|jgi:thiol:disulfide interchange protein
MKSKRITWVILISALIFVAYGVDLDKPENISVDTDVNKTKDLVALVRYQKEFSGAYVKPAQLDDKAGIAVVFKGTSDLHYYAKEETAAGGKELSVEAESRDIKFGKCIFPKWESFFDKWQKKNVEVYVGDFVVFVPIISAKKAAETNVEVKISGIACTSTICLAPFEKVLKTKINYSQADSWEKISFETADSKLALSVPDYPIWFAMGLALVAGLTLNIMPCVWPVLPIIVMRIVEQARENKARSIAMGFAFCFGILLFFACLAGANIILHLVYGSVLYWGDQFRNPAVVGGMALLLVVMALFMFGVFTFSVPSSIAGKAGTGKGLSGSVGMGFLAAILSTPCSFGILATAFGWAQKELVWQCLMQYLLLCRAC